MKAEDIADDDELWVSRELEVFVDIAKLNTINWKSDVEVRA